MVFMKILFFCALLLCKTLTYAGDVRAMPLDMCLIIDGSQSMSNTKDEIVDWLCNTVIEGMVQKGDTLTIWLVQQDSEIIFKDVIKDSEKDSSKTAIKNIKPSGSITNFDTALEAALKRVFTSDHIAYTLLVSSSVSAWSSTLTGKQADTLRFSKTENHRGWQSIVIAADINNRVRQAASSYMAGR